MFDYSKCFGLEAMKGDRTSTQEPEQDDLNGIPPISINLCSVNVQDASDFLPVPLYCSSFLYNVFLPMPSARAACDLSPSV